MLNLPSLSRRKLLKVLTLLGALPMLSVDNAIAYVKGSASAFNSGRSEINPNFLTGRAGEWPFVNQFKHASTWTRFDQTAGPIDPSATGSNLDASGYPQSTPSYGGSTCGFVVPSQNDRPGNYCFLWDGTGTNHSSCGESGALASCSFTGVIASNVLTASAVTGTIIPGQLVAGTGVTAYTIIVKQIAGVSGGAGTYQVSRTGAVSSTSMTASGGSLVSSGGANAGYYAFSTNTVQFNFAIGAVGSPYITNLRCFHVDDVVDGLAGKVFSAKFKERLKQGNWGIIRFLNWGGDSSGGANNSNVTTWSTRKPINYVYYDGSELRPSLYAGSATASGTAFSCSAPPSWAGLVDKAQVSFLVGTTYVGKSASFTISSQNVTMTAHGLAVNARIYLKASALPTNFPEGYYYVVTVVDANTIKLSASQGGAAITCGASAGSGATVNPVISLNVASTGDIPVLNYTAQAMTVGNNTYPTAGVAGSYATATYDAVLNTWIWYGGNAVFGVQGLNAGCPPELRLQLCIEMGAHLWDVTPWLAADPATDWMPSYMAMVHVATLQATWMKPIWEPPNENWNSGFATNALALLHSTAYGYVPTNGDGSNAYYGKVCSVIGQMAAAEFGLANKGVTYHVACGVQLAFGVATSVFNENLSSAAYVNQAQAPQSPYTKSAASGWVTFVSPSQYIVPTDYGTANETAEATAYNGILFTGYIAGSVLTVVSIETTAVIGTGTIANGQTLFGSNVPSSITIASAGTGSGGIGTYNLSSSIGNVGSASATQQFTLGTDLTQPGIYIATLGGASSGQNLAATAANLAGWKTWATGFGVLRMRCYEGGPHDSYDAGGTSQRDLLRSAARRVPGLQTSTTTNYTNLTGLTGGGFTAEFPSCFQLGGKYPSNNSWSIIENIWNVGYQTPYPPPEFAAIIAFNH